MLSRMGHETTTKIGRNFRAMDQDGRVVIVAVAEEALQDFGEDAAWTIAELKYHAGDVEATNGKELRVFVDRSDF